MRPFLSAIAAILFFTATASAQSNPPNQSPLTIPQIMQGEAFVGYLPENINWSDDSHTVYFSWNPDFDTLRRTWKINVLQPSKNSSPVFSKPEKVAEAELAALAAGGDYNRARTQKVFAKNGDLFLCSQPKAGISRPEISGWQTLQITNTLESENDPAFSADETKVVFEKGGNFFAWNIADGSTEQLTDFKKGAERKDRKRGAEDQFLYDDELELFDVLAERKMERDAQKRRQDSRKPKRPKPFFYGEKNMERLQISPDLRFVTFRLSSGGEERQTDVPNFVTESGFTETLKARSKVGSPQNTYELGVWDRQRDTGYFVEIKGIEGIFDKPAFLQEYHKDTTAWEPKYKNPRPVSFSSPVFSEDGKAFLEMEAQDNKDRWLVLLDLPAGTLRLLDRQHDDAWIGGPGIGGGNYGWLPDNRRIWLQSEESGFSHLYILDTETGLKKPLTSGKFEIINADLSNDGKFFYLTSNKETPFERHFYKLPVEGGEMQKITSLPGNHQITLSPDEKWLAVRYSFSNKPWELYLLPNNPDRYRDGAAMQQMTESTTPDFKKYAWREPELVWFKASDGADVPARLYRPLANKRNGAAVIFVHGAGYLQNVHRWWSNYYREFMFHNFLADNGFTILDVDYRGSEGYGRDWRTAIYRHMGGKDLSDQVDGANYLTEQHGIDSQRIGIYGGSYGGFITLMALFTSPGTFKSGAALRSVTDWAHYNHGYTANILNTPAEDSLAFRRSSPIYFAEGLQGNLLMLHGMVDVNVQFQDVVRLSQRLIELGKTDWELAVFPLEDHGFVEPSSWGDEYRRIWELFWETLRE